MTYFNSLVIFLYRTIIFTRHSHFYNFIICVYPPTSQIVYLKNYVYNNNNSIERPQRSLLLLITSGFLLCPWKSSALSTLSTNSAGELNVLRHDGDPLGVNSAQVRVLEQTHKVGFAGLLESADGSRLEPEICLEILGDFSHQTLERELADQQFS